MKLGTPSKLVTANRTKKALKIFYSAVTVVMMMTLCTVVAFAADGASGGGSDAAWQNTISFFVKWITRVGMVVAFVGAVMFGLAIKNNDAEQKQQGLLTMIAGFVVAALCAASSMFGMTT